MTKEERIEYILDLFDGGLLCNCQEYDDVFDEDRNLIGSEVRHTVTCEGRIKAREMLNEDKND